MSEATWRRAFRRPPARDPHPVTRPEADARATGRTLRWLLGAQIALAAGMLAVDLAPQIPRLISPSAAPELDAPTRPGDQTRRYRPRDPARPGPGIDTDMPRRLVLTDAADGVLIRGAIQPGDGARIAADLRRRGPERVALDSPGGSVADALEIGRTIRDIGADTVLDGTALCLSACPYAFAGGVDRTVGADAQVGVHQHAFGESTVLPAFLAVEDIQRGQAEVLRHLTEMGIDPALMVPAMATPADEIYILTREELTDWNLVTR